MFVTFISAISGLHIAMLFCNVTLKSALCLRTYFTYRLNETVERQSLGRKITFVKSSGRKNGRAGIWTHDPWTDSPLRYRWAIATNNLLMTSVEQICLLFRILFILRKKIVTTQILYQLLTKSEEPDQTWLTSTEMSSDWCDARIHRSLNSDPLAHTK